MKKANNLGTPGITGKPTDTCIPHGTAGVRTTGQSRVASVLSGISSIPPSGITDSDLRLSPTKILELVTQELDTAERVYNEGFPYKIEDPREHIEMVKTRIIHIRGHIEVADTYAENREAVIVLRERLAILLPRISLQIATETLSSLVYFYNVPLLPYKYDKEHIKRIQGYIKDADTYTENRESVVALREKLSTRLGEIFLAKVIQEIDYFEDGDYISVSVDNIRRYIEDAEEYPQNKEALTVQRERLIVLLPIRSLEKVNEGIAYLKLFPNNKHYLFAELERDIIAAQVFPENRVALEALTGQIEILKEQSVPKKKA